MLILVQCKRMLILVHGKPMLILIPKELGTKGASASQEEKAMREALEVRMGSGGGQFSWRLGRTRSHAGQDQVSCWAGPGLGTGLG